MKFKIGDVVQIAGKEGWRGTIVKVFEANKAHLANLYSIAVYNGWISKVKMPEYRLKLAD